MELSSDMLRKVHKKNNSTVFYGFNLQEFIQENIFFMQKKKKKWNISYYRVNVVNIKLSVKRKLFINFFPHESIIRIHKRCFTQSHNSSVLSFNTQLIFYHYLIFYDFYYFIHSFIFSSHVFVLITFFKNNPLSIR